MSITREQMETSYAAKMREWTDERLRQEIVAAADPHSDDNAWAGKEIMEPWYACLKAETARRGLTPSA